MKIKQSKTVRFNGMRDKASYYSGKLGCVYTCFNTTLGYSRWSEAYTIHVYFFAINGSYRKVMCNYTNYIMRHWFKSLNLPWFWPILYRRGALRACALAIKNNFHLRAIFDMVCHMKRRFAKCSYEMPSRHSGLDGIRRSITGCPGFMYSIFHYFRFSYLSRNYCHLHSYVKARNGFREIEKYVARSLKQ